jgi:hypothetical protein
MHDRYLTATLIDCPIHWPRLRTSFLPAGDRPAACERHACWPAADRVLQKSRRKVQVQSSGAIVPRLPGLSADHALQQLHQHTCLLRMHTVTAMPRGQIGFTSTMHSMERNAPQSRCGSCRQGHLSRRAQPVEASRCVVAADVCTWPSAGGGRDICSTEEVQFLEQTCMPGCGDLMCSDSCTCS